VNIIYKVYVKFVYVKFVYSHHHRKYIYIHTHVMNVNDLCTTTPSEVHYTLFVPFAANF